MFFVYVLTCVFVKCVYMCVISFVCAFISLLSCVCSLIYVYFHVLSNGCSHVCALSFVLSCVCSHVFPLTYALECGSWLIYSPLLFHTVWGLLPG